MSIADTTVDTLLSRVSWVIDGVNTADATIRPNYLWALNDALRELVLETDFWTFRMGGTLSTTANQSVYPLTDDFRTFIEPSMVFDETPKSTIPYVPRQSWDAMELDRTTSTSKPRTFTMLGRAPETGLAEVEFYPTPDKDYALTYRYFAYPNSVLSDTDGTTVLDRRFPTYFVQGLVSRAILHFPERITRQEVQVHSRNFEVVKRQMRLDNRSATGVTYQRARHVSGYPRGRRLWDGTGGIVGSAWSGGVSGPQ